MRVGTPLLITDFGDDGQKFPWHKRLGQEPNGPDRPASVLDVGPVVAADEDARKIIAICMQLFHHFDATQVRKMDINDGQRGPLVQEQGEAVRSVVSGDRPVPAVAKISRDGPDERPVVVNDDQDCFLHDIFLQNSGPDC